MRYYFFFSFSLFCFEISAQNAPVIDALAKKDSVTGAVVNVVQDELINNILREKTSSAADRNDLKQGWCVQVFSENSQSAKETALGIEKKIRTKISDEDVRTRRYSPFWKVLVGKFVTMEEAKPLHELLLKEFPELRGSIYIVKFSE
jgi:hypothetical protein